MSAHQVGDSGRGKTGAFLVTGAIATLPGFGYWAVAFIFQPYEHPDFVPAIWPILHTAVSASTVLCPAAMLIGIYAAVRGVICRRKVDGMSAALWFVSAVLFASMLFHFFAKAGAGL